MFNIKAQVAHNHAIFDNDDVVGDHVMVESFDNKDFEVFRGNVEAWKKLGVITAESDEDLSKQLNEMVNKRD